MSNWVADNLGGLGLPQMLGEVDAHYLRTGGYFVPREQSAYGYGYWQFPVPREMTAEDLGLPIRSDQFFYGAQVRRRPFFPVAMTDAPYSFWLGADTPAPIDIHDPRIVLVQP